MILPCSEFSVFLGSLIGVPPALYLQCTYSVPATRSFAAVLLLSLILHYGRFQNWFIYDMRDIDRIRVGSMVDVSQS